MTTNTSLDIPVIPVKPRVLIADDSRIVRATLIKHIEGMFDFREAHDGEQAWETLLLDSSIRVVITDLTMPKLDGYGLLQRIRSSKISRIRDLPVIVVSGSDEQRDRAKAAGATDLITKGIDTAQLLSRLDILSSLVSTQSEFERSLEVLVQRVPAGSLRELSSPQTLGTEAEAIFANAVRNKKSFVVLTICIGVTPAGAEGSVTSPPASLVDAVGQLLRGTVRQSDCVAKTAEAEFTLATGSINFDAARFLAERLCQAVANANLLKDERIALIASCGMTSLSDYGADAANVTLGAMRETAQRRALSGLNRAVTGVIGVEEAAALQHEEQRCSTPGLPVQDSAVTMPASAGTAEKMNDATAAPDVATLLQWIKEGKHDLVVPHIGKLSAELQPLVELILQKYKR